MENTTWNRAKDLFEAVRGFDIDTAHHYLWLAQCSEEERRTAFMLLDDMYAVVST